MARINWFNDYASYADYSHKASDKRSCNWCEQIHYGSKLTMLELLVPLFCCLDPDYVKLHSDSYFRSCSGGFLWRSF